MGNKIKAIIVLIAAVVIVGALHTYVFKPRMDKYKDDNDNLERLSNQFKSIVTQVSSEKDEGINNLQSLATEVDEVIQIIEDKIQTARNGFGELDKKLKIIERYDPSINYRDEVIGQIDRMRQLESSSTATKLTVSHSWEVDGGITEGRFGTGFKATGGRALAYANVKSKPIINPSQGTIEFFVKPDWDPTDTEIHHKCLFLAIDSRKFTRDQITQRLELEQANNENADNPMFERMNIQQMMPVGPGPFQKDSMIAIYKGEGATLSFELRDYVKPPSIVTAYISDWKPDTWYHITASWEPKRQALYINGSNRGVPLGGGQSIREARDAEEDALFTGGGGYGMGMMGMGGMGMG
ncbi:MAG: hypothetical protein JXR73_19760, partial [Candidatus Omnitrophica bacterium]|nr:hypothetical protein [Candidatus Omnitrophota bacterium]